MIKANFTAGNFTLEGSDVSLLQGMAEALNFTVEYLFDPKPGAWGMLKKKCKQNNCISFSFQVFWMTMGTQRVLF